MIKPDSQTPARDAVDPVADAPVRTAPKTPGRPMKPARELGGPSGLEPTRYGDWERNGRVSDF